MKYTKYDIENRLYELDSTKKKIWQKLKHYIGVLVFAGVIFVALSGAAFGFGMFKGILDSAPDINTIHVGPTSYATKTLDTEGNLVATLVTEGSNRERVSYDQIPTDLVNAFVAIEDERFWEHNGIDLKSILRAVKGVFTHDDSAGGGSTITQQLLKNNVFGGGLHEEGFEKYVRKFQEQYLALELESRADIDKKTVKESVITEYLNTINLGSNTLGVQVAARRYFNKDVSKLNLSECTVIASITKNPSQLNPISHPEDNAIRRAQVLKNMLDQGYITEKQYSDALADDVYSRIKNVDIKKAEDVHIYSYFTDELTEQVIEALMERKGYTKDQATDLLYAGGLTIYTTQDPKMQAIVDEEVNDPKNYDTAKYDIEWRYTIGHADGTIVNYSEKDLIRYITDTKNSSFNGLFKTEEAAHEYIDQFKAQLLTDGDREIGEKFNAVLEPQVSFVLMDPHTGEVKAISGGRGEKTTSLSLNRASNTLRQPGSTFKVLSSFAPAIDKYGATMATTFYDDEYTLGEKTFKNWYSSGYLGYQSIKDGIIYSLNIVAVRCLMECVQPKNGRAYAESLGITSLVDDDENGALALGGLTRGVSNLELTQAYGSIANGGKLNKAKFFTKILDQDGNVLIDTTEDEAKQVMKVDSAWLLTDAMSESMLPNRAYSSDSMNVNSTSTRAHFDGMSLAGKSGTTTNNNDIWFVGFSPYYIAGVWAGCDNNQSLNDKKTGQYNGGTSFHKDIWRKIMTRIHEGLEDTGFPRPADIVEEKVCRKSGMLPSSGCYEDYRGHAVINYYFAPGTVPTEKCTVHKSWGGIIPPEGDEDKDSDDHHYYYSDSSSGSSSRGSGGSSSSSGGSSSAAPAQTEAPQQEAQNPETAAVPYGPAAGKPPAENSVVGVAVDG